MALVPKKSENGELKYRFCTNFSGLNEVTKTDAYPLSLILETPESLGGSQWFTTLDLTSSYHQMPIAQENREKTAFTNVGGHFQYERMAFGLVNAPATFQRTMGSLFAEIKGEEFFIYLDDTIIFSRDLAVHRRRLRNVLEKLQGANLRVNTQKCTFAQRSVE